jgi:hypothetical protein
VAKPVEVVGVLDTVLVVSDTATVCVPREDEKD